MTLSAGTRLGPYEILSPIGAGALYFTVRNLEAAFERARALGCVSREEVHDAAGGGIVVRPWGEPVENPLCFVEEGTVYTG